jgi:AcrR family transcriptional regulator
MSTKSVVVNRKGEIVRAARELFFEHGYNEVSIQQIIDRIGIAKGTFYHHFESKDALLDAVTLQVSDMGWESIRRVADDNHLSAVEKFNAVFGASRDWKLSNKRETLAVYEAMTMPGNLPFRVRFSELQKDRLTGVLTKAVEEGIREGSMNTAFPAEAARASVAIAENMMLRVLELLAIKDDPQRCRREVEQLVEGSQDAVERVLGVESGELVLVRMEDMMRWFDSLPDG